MIFGEANNYSGAAAGMNSSMDSAATATPSSVWRQPPVGRSDNGPHDSKLNKWTAPVGSGGGDMFHSNNGYTKAQSFNSAPLQQQPPFWSEYSFHQPWQQQKDGPPHFVEYEFNNAPSEPHRNPNGSLHNMPSSYFSGNGDASHHHQQWGQSVNQATPWEVGVAGGPAANNGTQHWMGGGGNKWDSSKQHNMQMDPSAGFQQPGSNNFYGGSGGNAYCPPHQQTPMMFGDPMNNNSMQMNSAGIIPPPHHHHHPHHNQYAGAQPWMDQYMGRGGGAIPSDAPRSYGQQPVTNPQQMMGGYQGSTAASSMSMMPPPLPPQHMHHSMPHALPHQNFRQMQHGGGGGGLNPSSIGTFSVHPQQQHMSASSANDESVWHDPNAPIKKWQRDSGTQVWGDPELQSKQPILRWQQHCEEEEMSSQQRMAKGASKEGGPVEEGWGDLPPLDGKSKQNDGPSGTETWSQNASSSAKNWSSASLPHPIEEPSSLSEWEQRGAVGGSSTAAASGFQKSSLPKVSLAEELSSMSIDGIGPAIRAEVGSLW